MSGWRLGAYELDCHGTLRLGDRAIAMKTLQRQALLLLVRSGGAMVPRQRLIEGLWPDGPPRDPGALSQLIHGLRQVLEPPCDWLGGVRWEGRARRGARPSRRAALCPPTPTPIPPTPLSSSLASSAKPFFVEPRDAIARKRDSEPGAPTSSLADRCVDADGDVGVPALDHGHSSARWHRPALTGFWWM